MLAKIINEKTKEVIVANEEQREHFESIGFSDMDVEQAQNGKWYLAGNVPAPTKEEQSANRQRDFVNEADPLRYNYDEDCARYGYDSEQAVASKEVWLAKKDEIRERYPYSVGGEEDV